MALMEHKHMTALAPPAPPSPADLVSTLADLFPRAFVAERWRPHKPLRVGIDADLIATGVVKAWEVHRVLRFYCGRRMYLVATAAGGPRFDLDGTPVGAVTPQEAEWASRQLARMDSRPARETRKAAEARKAAAVATEERKEAPAPSRPWREKTCARLSSAAVGRLSLADLRAAAAAPRQVASIEERTT